jgi:hypothetical protein
VRRGRGLGKLGREGSLLVSIWHKTGVGVDT